MTNFLHTFLKFYSNTSSLGIIIEFKKIISFKLIDFPKLKLNVGDVFLVLFLILLTKLILKLVKAVLNRMVSKKQLDERNITTFYALISYFLYITTLILILEVVGIKVTLLLAGSAALLVGLGLGLQQIFSDIVSGIFILFEGSIKVNDIMEVDGLVGKVLKINLRTSEVLTRTGIIIIVPNHKFITENVVNWSHNAALTRFSVKVGVSYSSDPELVKEILTFCASTHQNIVTKRPNAPIVRLIDFGESSLDFELLFWSKEGFSIENIKSDVRFMILNKFREHNIEIPFPQRDLNFKN